MKKEEEVIFNQFFDMFNTEGWKQLVKDFTDAGNQINVVEFTKDEADLNFRKGQLNIIAQLVKLEDTMKTTFDDINSDENN